jgi:hypothetical protein
LMAGNFGISRRFFYGIERELSSTHYVLISWSIKNRYFTDLMPD